MNLLPELVKETRVEKAKERRREKGGREEGERREKGDILNSEILVNPEASLVCVVLGISSIIGTMQDL